MNVSAADCERILAGVEVLGEDDCWLWKRGTRRRGYGRTTLYVEGKKKSVVVSRFMWEWQNGSIPEQLFVCHHCDVTGCCNPHHLFLGTQTDNLADCMNKQRLNSPRGERQHSAKLTDETARAAMERLQRGELQKDVAATYGVSISAISQLWLKQTWRHLWNEEGWLELASRRNAEP